MRSPSTKCQKIDASSCHDIAESKGQRIGKAVPHGKHPLPLRQRGHKVDQQYGYTPRIGSENNSAAGLLGSDLPRFPHRMLDAAVTQRAARRAEREALDGKPTSAIALVT